MNARVIMIIYRIELFCMNYTQYHIIHVLRLEDQVFTLNDGLMRKKIYVGPLTFGPRVQSSYRRGLTRDLILGRRCTQH